MSEAKSTTTSQPGKPTDTCSAQSAGVQVSLVSSATVDWVWSSLGPQIERALSHGQGDEVSSAYIKEMVRWGRMSMWVVHEGQQLLAGLIFTVRESRVRKMYVEVLAGVRMDAWVDHLEQLMRDYAKEIGADCIEASCRGGLARRLGRRGWNQKAMIMELK